MSAQMAQRNIVQPKTLNFQGAGSQDLKYFEDMNEVIKSFSTRDFIKDSNLLKNIGYC